MTDHNTTGSRHPQPLGEVLSQLFTLRGYGRARADRQLADIWREVAGEQIASQTRVGIIKSGALQIGVANSALLSELSAFHKVSLLEQLQTKYSHLRIRDIKFKLRGDLA